MTAFVDAKLMTVVAAIKQSIETSGSPGLSVNDHPNKFFLNVIGSIDLLRAAEHVIRRLDDYNSGVQAKFERDVSTVMSKILTEFKAGAVNVEDAMARIYAKSELLVSAGAVEAAIAKIPPPAPRGADAETAASAVDGH